MITRQKAERENWNLIKKWQVYIWCDKFKGECGLEFFTGRFFPDQAQMQIHGFLSHVIPFFEKIPPKKFQAKRITFGCFWVLISRLVFDLVSSDVFIIWCSTDFENSSFDHFCSLMPQKKFLPHISLWKHEANIWIKRIRLEILLKFGNGLI